MGKILECVNAVLAESRILALEEKGSHRWRFAMQVAANVVEHPDDRYDDEWNGQYSRHVSRCTRCVALGRVLDRVPE